MLFILGLVLGVLVGAVAMLIFDFDVKIEYVTGKSARLYKGACCTYDEAGNHSPACPVVHDSRWNTP